MRTHMPVRAMFVLSVLGALIAGAAAPSTAGQPQPRALGRVPNAGYSVTGDGNRLTLDLASSQYRNYSTPDWAADASLQFGSAMMVNPTWSAKRSLYLTIVDPSGADGFLHDVRGVAANRYQCQGGAVVVRNDDAFMQCYQDKSTTGFYLDWPPYQTDSPGSPTPACSHATVVATGREVGTIDGSCMAHVLLRQNGSSKLVTEPGSTTPECFAVSVHIEVDLQ